MDECDALWAHLDVLVLHGSLWYDELNFDPTTDYLDRRRLSFSDWSFKVLVVRFQNGLRGDEKQVVELFLDVDPRDQPTFLTATERIEFIAGPKLVEEKFTKEVAKREKVGLSEFEKRIATLIVFVDEDGTERRLLENSE